MHALFAVKTSIGWCSYRRIFSKMFNCLLMDGHGSLWLLGRQHTLGRHLSIAASYGFSEVAYVNSDYINATNIILYLTMSG